jgi:hypothetical protein
MDKPLIIAYIICKIKISYRHFNKFAIIYKVTNSKFLVENYPLRLRLKVKYLLLIYIFKNTKSYKKIAPILFGTGSGSTAIIPYDTNRTPSPTSNTAIISENLNRTPSPTSSIISSSSSEIIKSRSHLDHRPVYN